MGEPEVTKTDSGEVHSFKLSEMTLAELVQLSQGMGHQVEKLREQRAYLKVKIDERIARGEHEHPETLAEAELLAESVKRGDVVTIPASEVAESKLDGEAHGAVIDTQAGA